MAETIRRSSLTRNRNGKASTIFIVIAGAMMTISFVCCGGCVFFFTNVAPLFVAREAQTKFGQQEAFKEQIGVVKRASVNLARQDEDRKTYKTKVEVYDIWGSNGEGQLIVKKSGNDFELCVLRTDIGEYVLVNNLKVENNDSTE